MGRTYHPYLKNTAVALETEKDPLIPERLVRKLNNGSLFLTWTGGGSRTLKYDPVQDSDRAVCYPDGFIEEERGMPCFSWDDRNNIYYSEFPLTL